ncbi:rod-binding protein [Roseovarius salinarum]|uniref:rod-binding protein n=1 Tax=Roseovarius salinarum TaxID=1981892 RepID=UPI001E57972F|nr:rod-binding protein [Roseovarius salinarum]
MTGDLQLTPGMPASGATKRGARPQQAARMLEASFIAEMLKATGFGDAEAFGGGAIGGQFASFHRQAVARKMAENGGLGLAPIFQDSLKEMEHDR